MNGADYWVEIFQNDVRLGAGFYVTRRYVLTADHCLTAGDPDKAVTLRGTNGAEVTGRLRPSRVGGDVAMVEADEALDPTVVLPTADLTRKGDPWASPYRPATTDPLLSGIVNHPAVPYICEEGSSIEALQLKCDQPIGDFSGYSGSPIEREESDAPVLLGILLEQYPDRVDDRRATDVLFAASIRDVLARFDCFAVGHLLKVLSPSDPAAEKPSRKHPQASSLRTMVDDASHFADWADACIGKGLLDREEAKTLILHMARNLVQTSIAETSR